MASLSAGAATHLGRRALHLVTTRSAPTRTSTSIPAPTLGRSGAYRRLAPLPLCVFAYWQLKLVWLKFVVMWRAFRLWAALDGVLAPENLPACVSRQYTLSGFWRCWHASFNRWLVRYVYLPLGGRGSGRFARWRNLCVVFGFVALWHDVSPKLMAWGALLPLAFAPELIAEARRSLPAPPCPSPTPAPFPPPSRHRPPPPPLRMPLQRPARPIPRRATPSHAVPCRPVPMRAQAMASRWPHRWQHWAYRHLVALGGACNILMLVAANIVGFAIDVDGGAAAGARILGTADGLRVLACALATLFVGVQLDLEIEARRAAPHGHGVAPHALCPAAAQRPTVGVAGAGCTRRSRSPVAALKRV